MSIVGSEQWMYSAGAEFYGFPIEQSLRFEDGNSAYLSRTPASAGSLTTWTWSGWVKRGNLGITATLFSSATTNDAIYFGSGASNLVFYTQNNYWGSTAASFRDTSAWYHIVCVWDTTNATAADRLIIYVNNERQSLDYGTNPALNATSGFNNNVVQAVGRTQSTANGYFDGYLADVNFVDGQALDPTSFGELKSGIWTPKDTSGLTFGTNGFRLQFGDSAAIGDDTSGNTNDWTVNNLVTSDVVLDSPTNNWCVIRTMNDPEESGVARAEGNLKYTTGSGTSARNTNKIGISNILPRTGKWYAEARIHNTVTSFVGVGTLQGLLSPTSNNTRYAYLYSTDGNSYVRTTASESISTHGGAVSVGDVVGIYVDMDAATPELYFSKNGQWANGSGSFNQSTPTSAITLGDTFFTADTSNENQLAFHCCSAAGATSAQFIWNFGQDSTFAGNEAAGGNTDANGIGDFFSTVPDDALALCTANLPSGAIDTVADETPEDYFNTVLYTGNGTTDTSITSVGFQPSLTWIKQRSGTEHHQLTDAVRGAPRTLSSSGTFAENNNAERLKSFDSDGFTLGNDIAVNQSSQTYVGWNWKAGGSGASNTDGSITSTVSVGATSQQNWFSVVSYTGTGSSMTFGHGLGVTPDLFIVKKRNSADEWIVYPLAATGNLTQYLKLHTTSAYSSDSVLESATSSVIGFGSSGARNGSGDDYIAYCFANADGLCKVGSVVGNGSADGSFIYTGFRPAMVLYKRSDSTGNWFIWDNKRDPYNTVLREIYPDQSAAEYTRSGSNDSLDLLSNGFKLRFSSAFTDRNASGGTYIYLAIASQGFKYANAR